jgi:hypothetical protein
VNQAAVDLVARTLPHGLPHAGDDNTPPRLIPLPGFRTTGMTDEQALEFVGQSAKLVAEALVNLIETENEIVPKADIAQLRQDAADAPDGTRIVNLVTGPTSDPVLVLTVDKSSDRVLVPASVLKQVGASL